MAKGFVTGAIAGVVVSGLLAAVVSEMAPPPPGAQPVQSPQAANVTPPPGSGFARPGPDVAPVLPAPDTTPPSRKAQAVPAPGPSPAPPGAETTPAARPTGVAEAGPEPTTAPAPGTPAPQLTPAADQPAPQGAEAVPPAAPRAETPPRAPAPTATPSADAAGAPKAPTAPEAGTPPAQPSEAEAAAAPIGAAPAPVAPDVPEAPASPSADTAPAPAPVTDDTSGALAQPGAWGSTESATAASAPAVAPPAAPSATVAPVAPEAPSVPAADNTPTASTSPAPLPAQESAESAKTANGTKIATALPPANGLPDVTGAPRPGLGNTDAPQPGFGKAVKGVEQGRLPTITPPADKGSSAADAGEEAPVPTAPKPQFLRVPGAGGAATTAPAPTTLVPATPQDRASAQPTPVAPPVKRYAAVFDAPQGKPLVSVILIDTGEQGLDRDALAALTLPVSFAISPAMPDAAKAARTYRAGGHEVLILGGAIAAGTSTTDLERLLAQYSRAVPQAVGLVDAATGGFEDNHQLSQQVVGLLSDMGLGLVTHARGLDAADQIARSQKVPSAQIYRDLDSEGSNAQTIRRTLDRAAFKAAQEGRIVVIGHTRPETLEGLKDWARDPRARTVAPAPLTATLEP